MLKFKVVGLVCGLLLVGGTTEAQFVRVGPGGGVSVRAPFVHVEVGPGGSTYVRAPFTSVVTPGYARVAPRYGYYPPGTVVPGRKSTRLRPLTAEEYTQDDTTMLPRMAVDPAQMDQRELRRHARAVAGRFENELRQTADGAAWTSSLRPGTIRDLLAEDTDRPLDSATVDQLTAILQSYDALSDSQGYPQITQLSGFREMREVLRELTTPPRERLRRRLATQWSVLYRDLGRFETGATWQRYLEPPPELLARSTGLDTNGSAPTAQELGVRQLEDVLNRYAQIQGPDEYRAVAQLGSFQEMQRLLAAYERSLQEDNRESGLQASSHEAIPAPRPLPQPR